MARIPLEPAGHGLIVALAARYSKQRFGKVVDPLGVVAHHRGVLLAVTAFELGVQRWRKLDPTLQCLAVQASAGVIGCSWCTDFGYWEAHHRGVDRPRSTAFPAGATATPTPRSSGWSSNTRRA